MATSDILHVEDRRVPVRDLNGPTNKPSLLVRMLKPFASLQLTVILFFAAILIVLFGTLAQVHEDIWQVMRTYFRVDFRSLFTNTFPWFHPSELFVWIDPKLFFPPAFFPKDPVFPKGFGWMSAMWPQGTPQFPGWFGFPAPKGWVIGALMLVNLFAAHFVRFKVQARGQRLLMGTGVLAVGALITFLVIASGSSAEGLQAKPWVSYGALWWFLQTSLFGLCGMSIYAAAATPSDNKQQRWMLGVLAGFLAICSLVAFRADPANEATMRILYQVLKATFAGAVLLAGCIMVFKKRAGIVLLHAGVGLMMLFDVLVGTQHIESQMSIVEGETTNFSRDMREVEFAIIDHSGSEDEVLAIDQGRFARAGAVVNDDRLPFKFEVLEYWPNALPRSPRSFEPGEKVPENRATEGLGKVLVPVPVASATGTDAGSTFDIPAAYVKLTGKDDKDLGVWMVSPYFDLVGDRETITIDGKPYDIALRFRRHYNDYTITLNDFQKVDYPGTNRARDFSSYITLQDPARNTKFDYRIWMNNPMRYAGKTYYQQSFGPDQKSTTLQVVDNYGWMTPYVACMMVVVGMFYHFGVTLVRFLNRRLREQDVDVLETDPSDETTIEHLHRNRSSLDKAGWMVTAALVAMVSLVFIRAAMPQRTSPDKFNIAEFQALPMWYKGRPMPIDTFARNALMQLSDRETYKATDDGKSQPAILWLLDMMVDEEKAREYRVIRIESDDVRAAIDLPAREGFTYSAKEVHEKFDKIIQEATGAGKLAAKDRTLFQRKMLELANRMIFYTFLEQTFAPPPQIPPDQPEAGESDIQRMTIRADQFFRAIAFLRERMTEFSEQYGTGPLPLVVPTHLEAGERPNIEALNSKWEPVSIADVYSQFYSEFPAKTPPGLEHFSAMIKAYKAGDVATFNTQLQEYRALLEKHESADDVPMSKVAFESWYNHFGAYNLCSFLYVFAFVLAVFGWLAWPQVFGRAAFWLTVLIFAVHTFAIVARIYISGRPPVTNLYSSAVFIGWAVVLFGLVMEVISRLGIATVAATMAGFLTLRIAHALAADGDTFVVLEAVLDTQFWLATHVVCITLGYATTYLAGLLGTLYILGGIFTRALSSQRAKELTRMTYGSLCFALFFSFWGTVLGGLWADDSWGRFWGWDPKENGALIIVLWNALALHARWGGMVKDRGLAVLSVLGNIVVSWSWFGVNELGVGLHSYGFTEGRLLALALFVMSQLVLVAVGLTPRSLWRSVRAVEI